MNGGYIMVDCTGINLLADSKVTVSGMYDKCKKAYESGKPIIAVNCEYGEGVPMTPISVMAIIEAGVYILTASILQIRVDSDNGVWIVPLINANAKSTKKG